MQIKIREPKTWPSPPSDSDYVEEVDWWHWYVNPGDPLSGPSLLFYSLPDALHYLGKKLKDKNAV